MSFVPISSIFNLAVHWVIYLSIYTLVKGKDVTVPFPGTENAYCIMFNDALADTITRSSIWTSLYLNGPVTDRFQCGRLG
jgi:hypothetical protein